MRSAPEKRLEMAQATLPTRVFFVTTVLMSVLLLGVLLITGMLARTSVLEQATSDVELLADVIERTLERDAMVPAAVEELVGEDMATTAAVVASWVATTSDEALETPEFRTQLKALVARSNLDEVWITDEDGHAFLTTVDNVDFTFDPSPEVQPQASQFYPLLEGKEAVVVQETRKREIDDQWFKYVAVAGVDGPRIVQVGREASDINSFRRALGISDLVRALLGQSSIEALYIVDQNLMPLRGDDAQMMGLSGFSVPERSLLQRMFERGATVTEIDEDSINVAAPFRTSDMETVDGNLQGAFYVSLSRTELDDLLERIIRVSTLLFIAGGLFAVVVSYVVAKRVASPIWDLTKAATAVQRGNYRHAARLEVEESDRSELGRLKRVFQDMATRVELREQELDGLVRIRTEEIQTKNHLLEKSQAVIEEQLLLARELQQATLPAQFPLPVVGLTGAARMKPALQVGGDFYDSFPVAGGRIGVVIADVSGKGVAAAFFAATAKSALREIALTEASPGACLTKVNESLLSQNPIFLFVTLNYAVFDLETKQASLASAGHPSPFVCDGSGNTRRIECPANPALGIIPGLEYAESVFELSVDESVVFFTDGISEAENSENEELTEEVFEDFLRSSSRSQPTDLLDAIFQRVSEHAGDAPQSDDITAAVVAFS